MKEDQEVGSQDAPLDLEHVSSALETPIAEASSVSDKVTSEEFSVRLTIGLPILYVFLLGVEVTRYIWTPITVFLYGLVVVFAVLALLSNTVMTGRILAGIALLISLSQMSKHLYMLFGGFAASSTEYWHWLRFGFSNLFEGILFDIPAIYNWGISEIQPTAFWSQTLLFLFRTSLEFLVIAGILHQYRHARRTWGKPQPKDHHTYLEFLFARLGSLVLLIIWGVPTVIGIGAIVSDGLRLESSWTAIRLATPVVLGAWLAWQSLRGLGRFSGSRNALLALSGIISGTWLAVANWPAFRDYLGL